ncbi:response regulator [Alkalibacter saccharofermentans]|uniref:Circadian input-output histidine kinase CikA n=1 Tax=Alkalibacter saccharofermentans DSM 14828 TaxID=1120975 RepID=A0A1M4SQF4_9FIRM|nr:response regulator [Alkalibacter saccharofermentans]SHE34412.1 Signal transduction histidine kinase [Alkalibacter saccharofermentans DSM 14828]
MKFKNLSISKQINVSLGAVFIIAMIIVSGSLYYIDSIWNNTADLYNHPLTIRRAVGDIKENVLLIHRDMRQLPFEQDPQEIEKLKNNIDIYEAGINRQMDILYNRYLGPQSNIDEVSDALAQWETIRKETIRLLHAGQVEEVENRVKASGIGGFQADKVVNQLTQFSDTATIQADDFFRTAQEQRNQVIRQMLLVCIGMLLLLIGLGYFLRNGILPPLTALISATNAMRQGKLDTRIQYQSPNELGELSRAFDEMAETIQKEIEYKENAALISSVMFNNSNLRTFCQELLKKLLELTSSQISAIYFLNDSNGHFERYESIGVKHNSLSSFSSTAKEGEFGAVLASKKVQHVTDIPSDAEVVFSTVSGDYKAKGIITIPIVNGADVVSVISLASIKGYSADSVRLINGLVNEITASLTAVLSSQRILEFSQKLQSTNSELEQQTKELGMQANELTEQNAELEMQKRQLDEASRLKTIFLSNMSHELRTPLNSVIALSGVLSRRLIGKIPEEEFSYLEIIERNGKNLLTLINDILDISRIEAGREEIEITEFNASHAIAEVVSMIQPQAQQQDTELLYESKESEIIINSDVNKFRHVLQNIVANAIKFTVEGIVEIFVSQRENSIEIIVKDTGIGIPKEHLPYIFDEFRQADGSTSRRFGGTGLGLSISKKYANLLGGTITVKSEPDVGSEFTLKLPIRYSIENQIKEQIKTDNRNLETNRSVRQIDCDLTEKTILLVEDNESAIIQIKDLIEDIGCKIQIAHDAIEAFAIIDQAIPDAMILDLMMPDVDGFKILEILRNAEPTAHIPVLILTAKHITKDELKHLKRNNIHQLIQKGHIKRLELQQAVANMLRPYEVKEDQLSKKSPLIEGKQVVLVVEDNPDNMTTVKALLEDHHTVLEAVNAHEGIEMAKQYLPNLVLMDIALPDINGIEAFKKIRKMPQLQHIPVIALTASVMKHDRETILSHGFDAFIAKPIIANEFFIVINEVLYGK